MAFDVLARLSRAGRTAACVALAAAVGLGAAPVTGGAQQGASQAQQQDAAITGRIVDATTGQPVADAQVVVVGTARMTRSGPAGNYRLTNMRPGTYQVQARLVGFRSSVRTVVVEAGSVTQAEFTLAPTAVTLDEVVITGQPSALARREIGTAVGTIDAERLVQAGGIQSTSQLLQSRVPGMLVLPGGGKAGQGSRVMLRGPTAFMEVAQPIVYVDGVRIDNSAEPGMDFGGASWSGLDDFAPEDIEHIEVVRGAAASALYGTEAANGVIQIFTKQGRGRTTQWNLSSQAGMSSTPADYWVNTPHRDWFVDEFTRSGMATRHYGSVRGTLDRFSYFASGTRREEQGVLEGSDSRLHNVRANMRVTPSQRVSLQMNTGFVERRMRLPYDGNNFFGLGLNALATGEGGYGVDPAEVRQMQNQLASTRYTAGATVLLTPWTSFTHRITAGADIVNADNTSLHPYGTSIEPFDDTKEGQKANYRREARTYSIDYVGQYAASLSPALRSTTSFGFQGYQSQGTWNFVRGQRFVGPGLITVGAAASTFSQEDRLEAKQAGFLLDQQFALREALFVTVGARLDGHSGFSRDDRYQLYPKISASYVASDNEYVPDALTTLRFRGAYGTAGQPPAGLRRIRSWVFIPAVGSSGITTGNYGDPTLTPEMSREVELGVDAGVLRDRIALELTYYTQRTGNAMAPIRHPPSTGFVDLQLANVAAVQNSGIELGMRAVAVEMPDVRWELHGSLYTNRNRVTRLNTTEDVQVFGAQWVRVGNPIAAFYDGDEYIGPAFPTRALSFGNTLRVRQFGAHFLLDHRGGHFVESNTLRALDEIATGEPSEASWVYGADSWRLREVGVSWDLPAAVTRRARASGAALTLSGRNLWRKQAYPGGEVEAHFNSLDLLGNQTMFDTPLPRQVFAGINITF